MTPAQELYQRMHGRALARNLMRGMFASILASAEASGHDISAALEKVENLADILPLEKATNEALEHHLTATELDELVAFYRGAAGAKLATFSVEATGAVTQIITAWTTSKLIAPALIKAGIDVATATEMGLDLTQESHPADWTGVDDATRAKATEVTAALGFPTRVDELVATQTAQLAAQGLVAPGTEVVTADDKAEIIGNIARLYASGFTVGDLEELKSFYQTPLGQKYMGLTPLLSQAGEQAVKDWSVANPGQLEAYVQQIVNLVG